MNERRTDADSRADELSGETAEVRAPDSGEDVGTPDAPDADAAAEQENASTNEGSADELITSDQSSTASNAPDNPDSANTAVEAATSQPPDSTADEHAAKDGAGHEMTFIGHLQELRVRLTRCLIGVFVGFLACYGFAEQLFQKLVEPLITLLQPSGGTLIYTGLPEAFFTHLKVAAIAGLFVASPYVFYQLWMFIAPGLYDSERKWMIPIALCSAVFFVSGALFGYYIVFPFGFQFFLGFATDVITPMPSVREYFSFSTSMLFAFGFIFELPLFIFFLARLGLVTHKSLRKHQKYAILASFIVGAILTPPDVVSQLLMAGPLCILYEVGIWVAYLFGKKPTEHRESDPPAGVTE